MRTLLAVLPLLAAVLAFWAVFLRGTPVQWRDDRGEAGQAEPEGDEPNGEGDDQGDTDDADDQDALGDAGKKALDRMKAERNTARRELREARRQLAEAQPPPAADEQPDPEAIKAEARREAQAAANARILRSEVKAAAGGKLTDPGDAVRLLDLTQFEVDEDGNVDEDEIAEAIDDLISKKPYLSAQGGKRFQGTGDGGARKGSKASQLTREEIKGMAPEDLVAAKAAGRLNDLLGIK